MSERNNGSFIEMLEKEIEDDPVHKELLQLFPNLMKTRWGQNFQYGARKGERKGSHLITTALTAHFFYKYLVDKYNEDEDRLLSLAALIHDMDKIYEENLKNAITRQNVLEVIENIGANDFLPFNKYMGDLVTLIAGHHKKTMLVSMESSHFSQRHLQKIENLIKAADIMTLHHSAYDAFYDERIKNYLDRFSGKDPSNGWNFFFHELDETRLPLTQVIHEKLVDILSKKEMKPVAFFQNGVLYLQEGDFRFSLESRNQLIEQLVKHISKKALGEVSSYIVKGANGIQIKDAVFQGFKFEEVLERIKLLCQGIPYKSLSKLIENLKKEGSKETVEAYNLDLSLYEDEEILRKAFLLGGLSSFVGKIRERMYSDKKKEIPKNKLEVMLKIAFDDDKEKYKELSERFGVLLTNQTKWGQKNVPNLIIAEKTRFSMDELTNRVEEMVGGFFEEVSADFANEVKLREYLESHISFPKYKGDFREIASQTFKKYSIDESSTCTICGSPESLSVMKSEEIPNGFQLQTFSNRLDIYGTAKLKHVVCGACRTSLMMLGKNMKFGYYVYLYPDTYFPYEMIKVLRDVFEREAENLQRPDKVELNFDVTTEGLLISEIKNRDATTNFKKINFFPALSFPLNIFIGKNSLDVEFMIAFMLGIKISKAIGAKFIISKDILPISTSTDSYFTSEEVPAPYKITINKCVRDEKYLDILFGVYRFWKKFRRNDRKLGELHTLFSVMPDSLTTLYELKKLAGREAKKSSNKSIFFYEDIIRIADLYIERGERKMSKIKDLAEIGFNYHLTAKGYTDYAVARAIDAAIKVMRTKRTWASPEDLKALIAYEISRGIMRSNNSKQNTSDFMIKEGAQKFAELFWDFVSEEFDGNILKFIKDWKKVRAAYISYFEGMILKKSKENKEKELINKKED